VVIAKQVETIEDAAPVLERGVYFIVVFWGERFRNYFLEFCLPSLLAPGNIPALRTRSPSKFLIATRPDDWEAMRTTAIFRSMECYLTPVFIEIPPCPPGRSGCEHMGQGHKRACEYVFRQQGYAVLVTPDSMLSDGSVQRLQQLAARGTRLVLAVALRFGEETFLGNLRSAGLIPVNSRRDSGAALKICAREMARAAVNGLHGETLGYEWDAPFLVPIPAAAWWRVPGEDGIVVHSISWAPLLIDYAAVASHDTSTFDSWTLDGDYIHRNIDWRAATYVVEDSDEIFLSSWTPLAEGPTTHRPVFLLKHRALRDLIHGAQVRWVYHSHFSDPMKRELFLKPVRWHARPLNAAWAVMEDRSTKILRTYLDKSDTEAETKSKSIKQKFGVRLFISIWLAIFEPLWLIWIYRHSVARRLNQIARGDRFALERVLWHVRARWHQLSDRTFEEPPPRPPT
jgi:hypothetical protein